MKPPSASTSSPTDSPASLASYAERHRAPTQRQTQIALRRAVVMDHHERKRGAQPLDQQYTQGAESPTAMARSGQVES